MKKTERGKRLEGSQTLKNLKKRRSLLSRKPRDCDRRGGKKRGESLKKRGGVGAKVHEGKKRLKKNWKRTKRAGRRHARTDTPPESPGKKKKGATNNFSLDWKQAV